MPAAPWIILHLEQLYKATQSSFEQKEPCPEVASLLSQLVGMAAAAPKSRLMQHELEAAPP